MTKAERIKIEEAIDIRNSAVNGESGEIVPRMGRMCGFLPFNVPILMGCLLLPPTMNYTILMQWINQSYMAGLNYANRNPSAPQTNTDLAIGYSAACSVSIFIAVALRKLTEGPTRRATGITLMALNSFVNALASGGAGYCNTAIMRQAEINKGIEVMKSPSMKAEDSVGISKVCAKKAVQETALSRVALSCICVSTPTVIMAAIN